MIYTPGEQGQGLTEYGLILVLIAVVVVFIVGVFGSQVDALYSQVVSMFPPS
jgi:Flp pilus assembly pilin Flp